MERTSKKTNIILLLIELLVVFLLGVGALNAYFSVVAEVSGNLTFGSVKIQWYSQEDGGQVSYANSSTLQIFPIGNNISRGKVSYLSTDTNGTIPATIGIALYNGSSSAFVRYYLHVYEVNVSSEDKSLIKSKDYAENFELGFFDENTGSLGTGRFISYDENEGVGTYFCRNVVESNINCFNSIKLKDSVPDSVFNKTLAIFVCFDAIQAQNEAYLSWNDERGYCEDWED